MHFCNSILRIFQECLPIKKALALVEIALGKSNHRNSVVENSEKAGSLLTGQGG